MFQVTSIFHSFKDIMHCPSEYDSNCTVSNSEGTASVSCVDRAHRYQVILLQKNYPNRVVVVNVSSGGPTKVPVTPGDRYCVMVLQEDYEVRYSSEFIAEEGTNTSATLEITRSANSARSLIFCKNSTYNIRYTYNCFPNFSNCGFLSLYCCDYDVG